MSQDILGYERTAHAPGSVLTGDYALVTLGGAVALVQQTNVNYTQQVEPIYEIGTPDLYWVTGQAMGQMTANAAVGSGGFFSSFKGGSCGSIESAGISLHGKGNCGGNGLAKSGSAIHVQSAVVQSLGATVQAGARPIVQDMNIKFAFLSLG